MPKPPPTNTPIPPDLPNRYRCAIRWTDSGTGQQAVNVLHMSADAGASPADIADAMNTTATPAMFQAIPASVAVDQVVIEELVDGGRFGIESLPDWNGDDTADSAFTPANSILLSLSGPFRGQAMKGRVYLPFTAENAGAKGSLTTALQSNLEAAWSTWRSDLLAGGVLAWIIVSLTYRDPITGQYVDPSFQLVTGVGCDPNFATQRRRQDRVGI